MILLKNINIVPERVEFREFIQKYHKIVDCIPQIITKLLILINNFVIFAR